MPLFTQEPDGTPREDNKYIMGRRNWCAVWREMSSGEMVFDIRVEREKGFGKSVGYVCRLMVSGGISTCLQVSSSDPPSPVGGRVMML